MIKHGVLLLALVGLIISVGANRNVTKDIIAHGDITATSVLIHRGYLTGGDFEWQGKNCISAIYIVRNAAASNESTSLLNLNQQGGFRQNFLQLWTTRRPIYAEVRLYSEPATQNFGRDFEEDKLEHSIILNGQAPMRYMYNATGNVSGIQIVDQTNGTGLYFGLKGLGEQFVDLSIFSYLFRGHVHLAVRIYAIPALSSNYETGQLYNDSRSIED